jgi:hypothetical protein
MPLHTRVVVVSRTKEGWRTMTKDLRAIVLNSFPSYEETDLVREGAEKREWEK